MGRWVFLVWDFLFFLAINSVIDCLLFLVQSSVVADVVMGARMVAIAIENLLIKPRCG